MISTRSVTDVPDGPGSMTWSKVIRMPGDRDSSTHNAGGSTRVTINVLLGRPFALLVMVAPGRNSPSIVADSMWSNVLHAATSIQACQTASAPARDAAEAWYEGMAQT